MRGQAYLSTHTLQTEKDQQDPRLLSIAMVENFVCLFCIQTEIRGIYQGRFQ